MPPVAPTQCQPLSSNAYTSYGIAFQIFAAGYVPDGVSQALLQSQVTAAVQQFTDSTQIVQYLINKGIIGTDVDQDEASKVVAATMLLAAQRDPNNGWSCCKNANGTWYPYHPKYGWDESQRCAE
jgi:hypothetical protein